LGGDGPGSRHVGQGVDPVEPGDSDESTRDETRWWQQAQDDGRFQGRERDLPKGWSSFSKKRTKKKNRERGEERPLIYVFKEENKKKRWGRPKTRWV